MLKGGCSYSECTITTTKEKEKLIPSTYVQYLNNILIEEDTIIIIKQTNIIRVPSVRPI